MPASEQSQAIVNANQIISLAGQLLVLSTAITAVNNAWTDDGTANVLNAMGTAALNADGTLGTLDGTPNVTHPINTGSYASLTRAISANQIAALLTVINTIPSLVAGNAVSAQVGMRGILDAAVGG